MCKYCQTFNKDSKERKLGDVWLSPTVMYTFEGDGYPYDLDLLYCPHCGRPLRLILSYDDEHDTLYVSFNGSEPSYIAEDNDSMCVIRRKEDDSISAMFVYRFKERTENGAMDLKALPIPLDSYADSILELLVDAEEPDED